MPSLLFATFCAALMGFAIQRGGTCLVAAVDEIVANRSASRLLALVEASLLVAAGIVVAALLGALPMPPHAYASTGWTVAGGVVMGLGAYVAGACVFGAIARIGNGEPAYLMVPAGFFAGCIAAQMLGMGSLPHATAMGSPILMQPLLFAGPLLVIAGWRLWQTGHAARRRELLSYIWSPHVATSVIGVTFVILFLTVGAWNYTDYLAEAARHMGTRLPDRSLLLAALFGGALLGGWSAGRIQRVIPTAGTALRCFAGGAMLGFGGSLVPGANDGLILLGLPLLYPHAWLAFASMLVAIAATLVVQRVATLARKSRLA